MTKNTNTSKNVTTAATGFLPKLKQLAEAIRNANLIAAGIRGSLLGSLIAGQIVMPVAVLALPTGAEVKEGLANFGGDQVTGIDVVNQTSSRVVIDWQTFDIGSAETLTFNQAETDIAVNNVIGGSFSKILGSINAQGNIVLVNPNGLVFADGASINVGGLVASTLSLDTSYDLTDFVNDTENTVGLVFKDSGSASALTSNAVITASGLNATSSVVFLGGQVTNAGTINASVVNMIGADGATITFGSDVLGIESIVGASVASSVVNSGTIAASQITLEASTAANLLDAAVNNTGTIQATGIATIDGEIRLVSSVQDASAVASVSNSGNLTAVKGDSANNAAITIQGSEVSIGSGVSTDDKVISVDTGSLVINAGDVNVAVDSLTIEDGISFSGDAGSMNAYATALDVSNASSSYKDLNLVGENKALTIGTSDTTKLKVNNLTSVSGSGSTLNGTTGADAFTVNSASEVGADSITFTGVGIVAADAGSDSVTTTGIGADLTGANYELKAAGIIFKDVETASLDGQALAGSDLTDTFSLQSASSAADAATVLLANAIQFKNLSSTIDAKGDQDTVNGFAGVDWTLGSTNSVTSTNGYTFNNIEIVDVASQTLNGTMGDDAFTVNNADQVIANEITFKSVTNVAAGGGSDHLTTSGVDADLTGTDNELEASGITFKDIETASLNNQTLNGTASDDDFTINGSAEVGADSIVFSNVGSVEAGDGRDNVTTSSIDAELTGTDNQLKASGITFAGVETANLNSQTLNGTASDDEFTVNGSAEVGAYGIVFSNVGSVEAGDGSDNVTTSGIGADLTDTDNELKASGITFTDIQTANLDGQTLAGTDTDNETFEISTADKEVTVNGMNLTSVAAIDAGSSAGDAITTTESVNAELTGTNNELTASGISFSAINNADLSNGVLGGSGNADTFELSGASLLANNILFSAINSLIDAKGGNDQVTGEAGTDWNLTEDNKQLSSTNFQFQNIETADLVGSKLIGTDTKDETFEISSADNKVAVNGMNLTSVGAVDAGSSTGDAITTTESVNADLTAADNALTASGINFTNVNSADLSQGKLTGSDIDNETFEISTAANAVTVNGMSLISVGAIDAGTSAGDAITTTELVNADLTTENNALTASGIDFTNVNSADLSQGQLTGTDAESETFEISTVTNAVAVNGMNLTSVGAVDAGSSTDDAITTTELVNADLTAANNALTASGINFTQVNSADLSQGQLTGTNTKDEIFEISSADNKVAVNGMNLTSVGAVDAGTNTGDAITTTESVNANLTAENNALTASGIDFTNVNSADLSQGQLTGTDSKNETFEISTADNKVAVNGINLTSVAAIDAGSSAGDAITAVVAVDATLAAAQKELTASSIVFTNINAANLNSGALNGTNTEAETFQISTALNQVNVNGIDLTNVSAIDAGTDLGDTVVTTELVNAALTSDTNALTASGINFSGLDSMDLSQGVVTGTDSSETFEISNTNNAVTVNGMSLTAVSAVNAGSSMDDVVKVATGVQATADLTAVDNQISASAITFNDVDTVKLGGGTLNGSNSENEVYVVNTTANALAVKNMQFESVDVVNGGADSIDSIATLGVAVDAQLTGADKQLLVSDITFSDISSANMSGGRLSGSDEADTIQLTSAGMAANEINFYLINSAVDTQGGDDTVIGRAGVDWTLTGINGEINSVRYQFKNVENVDVVSEGVTGSAIAETFELGAEESQVIVNQLTLSNVATVTADLNDTLLGTSGDDVFNVNSDTSVITNSTTFDGMENLNGGEGQDTLISNVDGLAWIINQASDGVNSLGDFLFSQFEVLNNNVGNLNLSTSLQAVFAGESVSFIGGNSSTASIQAVPSDMNLNFNGQKDVIINSTYVGKNAITGNLIAHLADVNASGDIDLDTEIDILNVSTNDNRSINATFVQNGDLVLRTIDVGDSGTVILDSAVEGTGLLTTETRNEVNFVAKSVSIGTGKSDRQGAGLWEGVGSSADASQLTFDVSFNLDLEALYYVTPFFPNGAPITSQLEGIESDSLISSQQSALIITDTVQNLAQLDPAIFESLTPYIADANSIAGADNYYASSEVPSTLDTAQLAALLSSYEPTAAGGVNYDEYKLDGESEEDDEKKKLAKKLSKAGTFVADDNSDIKVAYSESGEMLGVVKDYVFQAGDSLWSLSKRYLGNGFAWTEIAKQNPSIKNPSSIADGQIIKVVVKVSDEIGQILKSAISAGGISKEGNSATLPASLRREVALP
ncbi:filamentous hemagglutinin N-terminal domain-containing protein [Thalassolituus sp.]|uniref:filamentous hemagglutinin N-terminal domain-containing protein n=1 Tax=Thalassolituus sp. TaxID=2030822 RepID=UPI002A7EED73|nr:filamentous hemagglutinin N-terminal domain-containing protein [Thalassolituus sp.]